MATDPNTLVLRRRYAGIAFGTAGMATLLAVFAQSTPDGSALDSIALAGTYANRAFTALFLWAVASTSILVGSILTANSLRGPRTRVALSGTIALSIGALFFFAIRIATGGLRYLLGVAGIDATGAADVDRLLTLASGSLIVVVVLLVLGGSAVAIGFDHSGASSWFTSLTWSISLVCHGLVAGVWWAEALTGGAIALALLVMGVDIARFRQPYVTSSMPGPRVTSW